MKKALVLILSFAAATFAADQKPVKDPGVNSPEQVKRLGSVTWDLKAHKLVWVVQQGTEVNGDFVAASEQQYEISPDDAVMAVANEQRGFDSDEATSLQHLLDVLSVYCAESVVWWDQGEGTQVPGTRPGANQPTKTDPQADSSKPVRVGQPEPNKKPQYKVPDTDNIAMLR